MQKTYIPQPVTNEMISNRLSEIHDALPLIHKRSMDLLEKYKRASHAFKFDEATKIFKQFCANDDISNELVGEQLKLYDVLIENGWSLLGGE